MEIIGVGIGRTGSLSLKLALEKLGYKPCYHILDVLGNPGIIKIWLSIASGKTIDWKKLFRNYRAGLDYPFPTHYQEYLDAFPEVKVILTVRDPDEWYESATQTIFYLQHFLINWLPWGEKIGKTTIWYRLFKGRFKDKDFAIMVFKKHTEDIKECVPEDQLLVMDVKEGWRPLCHFLDIPIPDTPFPYVNRRQTVKMLMALALVIFILFCIGVIFGFTRIILRNQ